MVDPGMLTIFIPASLLLIIAPGPDILFVVAQGISSGKRAGFFIALGLAFGNSVHTLAAALGVSLIFKTSVVAFTVFKVAGAAYLFYLAYKVIKHRKELMKMSEQDSKPVHHLIAKGFVMNVLNPKVARIGHGRPARPALTLIVTTRPVGFAAAVWASAESAVSMNNVLPSSPPNIHAKHN